MGKDLATQSRILRCVLEAGEISKNQIAKTLNLSMPTVLQAVKKFVDQGIVCEIGVDRSTVGRKAKLLSLSEEWKYALGIDITKNHIGLVLLDMKKQVVKNVRRRKVFCNSLDYCREIAEQLELFIKETQIDRGKILGVGMSLPGIVNRDEQLLLRSHILQVENLSLKKYGNYIDFPMYFENDANAALMAELKEGESVLYLSLSNSVGGAVCIDGELFRGGNLRAGEFGHIRLHTNGKKCYCGNYGCVDTYCSSLLLRAGDDVTLEDFFKGVELGEEEHCRLWDEYLDNLALVINNLRIAMDMDIILGGYVGYYLRDYMGQLSEKVLQNNLFDMDAGFMRNCIKLQEVSAVGAAGYFIDQYINEYTG